MSKVGSECTPTGQNWTVPISMLEPFVHRIGTRNRRQNLHTEQQQFNLQKKDFRWRKKTTTSHQASDSQSSAVASSGATVARLCSGGRMTNLPSSLSCGSVGGGSSSNSPMLSIKICCKTRAFTGLTCHTCTVVSDASHFCAQNAQKISTEASK